MFQKHLMIKLLYDDCYIATGRNCWNHRTKWTSTIFRMIMGEQETDGGKFSVGETVK
jgi:hypothetical protein